jgi:ribonuclease HI
LDKEASRHEINWLWVKGHNGHLENELVDKLAREAIKTLLKN